MTLTHYLALIIAPILIGLWAQWRVKSAFGKYSQVRASSNVSGAQAAREVLAAAQIHDVEVVEINGMLGDHYDPSSKRLCLSSAVYNTPSVAALGIAAHEAGHAIQHARHYAPLKARMALVPITMVASNILYFIFIASWFLHFAGLFKIGFWCFLALAAFQVITLPVEFDASARAKVILQNMGFIRSGEEVAGVNRVLDAAALTYVAALVATIGNLIYFFLLSRDRE
ncbi:MAG TPA: zinc metallopeptidase [Chthoniobacteraceae bacterium]|nr:zinc metallopeptidase [Chthoniobacteraceae bacterium]